MTTLTAQEQQTLALKSAMHEHAWGLESAHVTSEGQLQYMKCIAGCCARRVELLRPFGTSSTALSKVVGAEH